MHIHLSSVACAVHINSLQSHSVLLYIPTYNSTDVVLLQKHTILLWCFNCQHLCSTEPELWKPLHYCDYVYICVCIRILWRKGKYDMQVHAHAVCYVLLTVNRPQSWGQTSGCGQMRTYVHNVPLWGEVSGICLAGSTRCKVTKVHNFILFISTVSFVASSCLCKGRVGHWCLLLSEGSRSWRIWWGLCWQVCHRRSL